MRAGVRLVGRMAPFFNTLYRPHSFPSWATSKSVFVAVAAIGGFAIVFVACACCRKKKIPKAAPPVKSTKSAALKLQSSIALPPREPLFVDQNSRAFITTAFNLYNHAVAGRRAAAPFVCPAATQLALAPFYMASTGMTKNEFRNIMFQQMTADSADDALKMLASAIAPKTLDGSDRGWQHAVRMYAPRKRMAAMCPAYIDQFSALNESSGKVMEMVGFDQSDVNHAGPCIDDLNEWAKRNVTLMQQSLFKKEDKKRKTLFIRKPGACFVAVAVCGFQCQPEVQFLSTNVSTSGHPFLSYDGRKQIRKMPMLHSSEEDETRVQYFYSEDDLCQCLRIPLKNGSNSGSILALYVFLPKKRGELSAVEKRISPEWFISMLENCNNPQQIRIVIPTLRLQCNVPNLLERIKNSGLQRIFSPKAAELALMIAAKDIAAKSNGDIHDTEESADNIVTDRKVAAKQPKRKGRFSDANPCVTDVVYAGVFQLLDADALMASKTADASDVAPGASKVGKPVEGSDKGHSRKSTISDTSGNSDQKGTASRSKEEDSPATSKNSGSDRLGKSGSKGKSGSSNRSGGSDSKKSDRETDAVCPVCARFESSGIHSQPRKFIADHPFLWAVVMEKPAVIPLVIGRFYGE